jgi:uncharacterized protein with PIN domain
MDGTAATLKEKLDHLLHQAAEVSVALDRANGTIVGIPHYSVIETRAHELGQQLSRLIQARQMGQFAAHAADFAPCPKCGARCQLDRKERRITSIDGSLMVKEPVGHCPRCRRGFFPLPRTAGLRRP